jgi:hypothetical protein
VFANMGGRLGSALLPGLVAAAPLSGIIPRGIALAAGVLVAVFVWFVYPVLTVSKAVTPRKLGPTLPPSLRERERAAAAERDEHRDESEGEA